MRCRRVGANVSPMRRMLSLALMLIKPALLSQCELAARRPVISPVSFGGDAFGLLRLID
jgi:hypothetical protein